MTEFNKYELEFFAKQAADAYLSGGKGLDDSITTLARENDFTDDHVDRVAQAANSLVNTELVKQARDVRSDPRVAFAMADAARIKDNVHGRADKIAADLRQEKSNLKSLFTMPPRHKVAHAQVLDAVVGSGFSDPLAKLPRPVDHWQLTQAYVKEAHVAEAVAGRVSAESLAMARQNLETLTAQARVDASMAKQASESVAREVAVCVEELLLSGTSPATLRDVVKTGISHAKVAGFVDKVITDAGAALGVREGRSQFSPGSLVNGGHPLLTKISEIDDALTKRARADRTLSSLTSALSNADRHCLAAVRDRR